MSQPQRLDTILRDWWQSELYKRGTDALRAEYETRRVSPMTTDEDFLIAMAVAALIEDEADNGAENPKTAAKEYVRNTLDNGWISSNDDVPVWQLVARLGHDRDNMDSLAVYHQIAGLIDENDFFNG